ncbi:MAG TPA: hypothetical protein DCZ92_00255 [Elusimicrobia bacterium]|nr:MAG: hypothetical protein A2016_09575 [Elusimicrobia bacterium GWF2_62_30]HBA59258.1 hypothetical protein [Elusimicrobiota bacterium]
MTRPLKLRKVSARPRAYYFKPRAIPLCELMEVALQLDEFQALKYSELDGKDQAAGAAAMKISRQTFGNILASARRKLADAVVNGKALKIEGGPVELSRPYCGGEKK